MARMRVHRLGMVAALLVTATPLSAGSLEIGPTRVQMIGPERTATLTIRNVDSAPSNIQVRTVDWSQPEGADLYAPSKQLLASPPMVTLAPGESQVIRLVVEDLPKVPGETAFRLILDEIRPQRAEGGAGVQAALRALVPVFVTPSTQSRPKLRWTAARSGQNVLLTAHNDGDARDRLVNLNVTAGGKAVGDPLEGYVLSRARRSWTLAAVPAATSLRVAAEGDYGAVQADVPIGQ
ncbi:molecular chaperone [Sphingomonas cavernae]|uniref:Molecular chaperone n=1 Tax=Sphingomonas cavernae TaxID=2320861 RepID=A0A418W6X2_9SPHN|nr:molecular chaperone [Sphingomonas cavernae]RJF85791.1 molecular chaperone [Sphingomonas cavernae]